MSVMVMFQRLLVAFERLIDAVMLFSAETVMFMGFSSAGRSSYQA